MIPTKEFLEKYPVCPLCSGEWEKKDFTFKKTFLKHLTIDDSRIGKTFYYMRCKHNGHCQVNFKAWEDQFVGSISATTEYYDVRIWLNNNTVSIIFGESIERTIECKDYTKWMLPHHELLDKIKLLWVIA